MTFVEFLDESHFVREWKRVEPDPWLYAPLDWLERVVQGDQWSSAKKNEDRLAWIAGQGRDVHRPVIVVIDGTGRITLEDGHHRLVHARRYSVLWVRTTFKMSEKIKVRAPQAAPLLVELFRRCKTNNESWPSG